MKELKEKCFWIIVASILAWIIVNGIYTVSIDLRVEKLEITNNTKQQSTYHDSTVVDIEPIVKFFADTVSNIPTIYFTDKYGIVYKQTGWKTWIMDTTKTKELMK